MGHGHLQGDEGAQSTDKLSLREYIRSRLTAERIMNRSAVVPDISHAIHTYARITRTVGKFC